MQRKIRKVLVIDRIELVLAHEIEQMRELHRDHSLRLEQELQAPNEIVELRHMSQHVVPDQEVGALALRLELGGEGSPKELHDGGYALLLRGARAVLGRFDPQHGNVLPLEILEQVTIVAGDLKSQALAPEGKAGHHVIRVGARMIEPGVGVGRKVRIIVAEYRLRTFEFLKLYEEARRADVGPQRIE